MKKSFVILIGLLTFASCKQEVQEVSPEEYESGVIVIENADVEQPQEQPVQEEPTTDKHRYWSAEDIKIPKGTVRDLDCAGCRSQDDDRNPNYKDNYVVIEGENTLRVIVRDIDEDTYMTLRIGDIIK